MVEVEGVMIEGLNLLGLRKVHCRKYERRFSAKQVRGDKRDSDKI